MKNTLTAKDKKRFAALKDLGCIICERPPHIHHIRKHTGLSKRPDHDQTIPLCNDHHTDGGHGVALHAGVEAFEKRFGTQEALLIKTNAMLAHKEKQERGWLSKL